MHSATKIHRMHSGHKFKTNKKLASFGGNILNSNKRLKTGTIENCDDIIRFQKSLLTERIFDFMLNLHRLDDNSELTKKERSTRELQV